MAHWPNLISAVAKPGRLGHYETCMNSSSRFCGHRTDVASVKLPLVKSLETSPTKITAYVNKGVGIPYSRFVGHSSLSVPWFSRILCHTTPLLWRCLLGIHFANMCNRGDSHGFHLTIA